MFDKKDVNGVTVVSVPLSRATLEKAGGFREYLTEIIEKDNKKIVVDLSLCDFVDSTFLGVLVASLKKAVTYNGDLRLVFTNEMPLGILHLTRMDKVFKIYNDLDEAVNSYN